MKPTCRISWATKLLILLALTFGPSLKAKQWFTGFGELSFWWIQICIGPPMRRSSFYGTLYLFEEISLKMQPKDNDRGKGRGGWPQQQIGLGYCSERGGVTCG